MKSVCAQILEILKQKRFQALLLSSAILIYWLSYFLRTQLELSHIIVGSLTVALFCVPERYGRTKHLVLPLLFTLVLYDSQRLYSDFLRGKIHIVEPYAFDIRFFGISHNGALLTPNEWWQKHTSVFLDAACGFAYLVFIPEFFLLAAFYAFFCGDRGAKISKEMTWGFFWLNAIGYTTYYWYAAAPPWYVADHGLTAAADLSVRASLAGCIRFDEWIGLPVFKTWYGNSADVFGAIPSLHVAYPFLAIIYSFKIRRFRLWSIFFYFWVSFSAIYLNHHYILDVLWGTFYALIIGFSPEIFSYLRLRLPRSRSSL